MNHTSYSSPAFSAERDRMAASLYNLLWAREQDEDGSDEPSEFGTVPFSVPGQDRIVGDISLRDPLSPVNERILVVLAMARRPLRQTEIEGALGLPAEQLHNACKWLSDHRYIDRVSLPGANGQRSATAWSMADRGEWWTHQLCSR
ncbi:MAG TPA: hypothetical protein VIL32_13705 [Steroidobacteraceae bacterium]